MKEKKSFYFFNDQVELDSWKDKYYRDIRIPYLLVPYLAGRETALISASGQWATARHLKIHSVAFLHSGFNAFSFFSKDYMVYYSLASYMNHPLFSYNPVERQRQQREWTDGIRNEAGELIAPAQMSKYITGYQLFFDFDCHGKIYSDPKRSEAYRDCKALSDDLSKWGVKYRITFSGSGWHLVIPYQQFASVAGKVDDVDFMASGNVFNFCVRVRERIVNMLGLGSVDLTIVDAARVCKCPMSMTKYGTVALPMESLQQFENFSIDSCDPRRVLARQDLYMKGEVFTCQGTPTGFERYLEKRLKKW